MNSQWVMYGAALQEHVDDDLVRTADRRPCARAARHHRLRIVPMTAFITGAAINSDGALRGPSDPLRIDIHAPAELRHWVREIGRPADQLKQAVNAVGPLAADVRAFLKRRSLYRLR
jgi:hypothetical protein